MRVVIVGMGETGRELAGNLGRKKNNELVLIDQDEGRCETLSSDFDALVIHGDGSPPGLWRGLGREALKILAVGNAIGAFIAMIQLILVGFTWYEQLCRTAIEFKPYVRLTKTQKKFRKEYKSHPKV